jgi:hypothetical protein
VNNFLQGETTNDGSLLQYAAAFPQPASEWCGKRVRVQRNGESKR